jgi:hypothetical protein
MREKFSPPLNRYDHAGLRSWCAALLALDVRRFDSLERPRPARWLRRTVGLDLRPTERDRHMHYFWHYDGQGTPSLEIHVVDLAGKPVAVLKSE